VTVAIPTYNEADHIEAVLEGFLHTSYPGRIEVIVADGGSTDETADIVQRVASRDPRVRLIANPKRIQAEGLNRILRECTGEVFLRADAHCIYAPDYLERCVEILGETGAVNVGGAQRLIARNAVQAGVALAYRSILGSGGARYRDPSTEGWVEAVYLGCFRRDVLVEVGGYAPMPTNEDAELNLRLLEWAERRGTALAPGGSLPAALYTSSRIKVWYYPRTSWAGLFRQYLAYGRGRCRTVRAHPDRSGLRGRLPLLLVTATLLAVLTDLLILGGGLHSLDLCAAIVALAVFEGARTALRLREPFTEESWRGPRDRLPPLPVRALLCAGVILIQPIAHSLGFGSELLAAWLRRGSEAPDPAGP
jgi:hypothetical protein